MDALSTPAAPGDIASSDALLQEADAHAKYYATQDLAFRLQMECLKVRSAATQGETYEATLLQNMLERLRYTTSVLRMKYAFPDSETNRIARVELTDSGFPHHHYITSIDVDLVDKEAILADLPSAKSLEKNILQHLLQKGDEPRSLLKVRAKRAYLEMLDPDKLFLPFTMGPVIPWPSKVASDCRRYVGGWGCYDRANNIPYIHFMVFDQDAEEQPFEEKGENFTKFLRTLRLEGSLTPEKLSDFAYAFDHALDPIHPKLIKRVRIGPLYIPHLIAERGEQERSDIEKVLLEAFERADCMDGFALLFNEQLISSGSQKEERTFFRTVKREIFLVPQLDEGGASEAGATRVYPYVLMPHRVYQTLRSEDKEKLPRYAQRVKFGYDEKGTIYEIG